MAYKKLNGFKRTRRRYGTGKFIRRGSGFRNRISRAINRNTKNRYSNPIKASDKYKYQFYKYTVPNRYTITSGTSANSGQITFSFQVLNVAELNILQTFAYVKLCRVKVKVINGQNEMQSTSVTATQSPLPILYLHPEKAPAIGLTEANMIQAMSGKPRPKIMRATDRQKTIYLKPYTFVPVNIGSYASPANGWNIPTNKWLLTDTNNNWAKVLHYGVNYVTTAAVATTQIPLWYYYVTYYVAAKGQYQDY